MRPKRGALPGSRAHDWYRILGEPCAPASIVILFSYVAAAVSGAVAGRGVRGALTSADTDVMCRANSSGTAARLGGHRLWSWEAGYPGTGGGLCVSSAVLGSERRARFH